MHTSEINIPLSLKVKVVSYLFFSTESTLKWITKTNAHYV